MFISCPAEKNCEIAEPDQAHEELKVGHFPAEDEEDRPSETKHEQAVKYFELESGDVAHRTKSVNLSEAQWKQLICPTGGLSVRCSGRSVLVQGRSNCFGRHDSDIKEATTHADSCFLPSGLFMMLDMLATLHVVIVVSQLINNQSRQLIVPMYQCRMRELQ